MPPSFALDDDYWLCFFLNHCFNISIFKIQLPASFERAQDSDTLGLALRTRKEVMDARISMHIHRMTRGWPFGTAPCRGILVTGPVLPPLSKCGVGELGVQVVRVSAVSSSERTPSPDLCYLLDSQGRLDTLALAVRQVRDNGFKLVLTL